MKKNELDRKELAQRVADRLGKSLSDVQETLDTFFSELTTGLADAERAEIHELGTFSLKKAAARSGSFQGQPYNHPEGLRIKFKAAKAMLSQIAAKTGKRTI